MAADSDEAAMPGAKPRDYSGTERSTSPGWINQLTRQSIRELLSFDAASAAEFITPMPTLLVPGRSDQPRYVDPAIQRIRDWMTTHLSPTAHERPEPDALPPATSPRESRRPGVLP